MKMISALSRTSWLSAATVMSAGNSAARAADLAAPRGDKTTALHGGTGSVQTPRTIALDMVPTPTMPYLTSDIVRVNALLVATVKQRRGRSLQTIRDKRLFNRALWTREIAEFIKSGGPAHRLSTDQWNLRCFNPLRLPCRLRTLIAGLSSAGVDHATRNLHLWNLGTYAHAQRVVPTV